MKRKGEGGKGEGRVVGGVIEKKSFFVGEVHVWCSAYMYMYTMYDLCNT